MNNLLLSSAYLPPVEYLAWIYWYSAQKNSRIFIEQHDHYIKQTYRNRCTIFAANGPTDLTIPVEKPSHPNAPLYEIRISNHGNWRHLHWNALTSAYRSSPFFDYYADDFAPFYEKKWLFLIDYNEALLQLVCKNMGFTPQLARTEAFGTSGAIEPSDQTLDLRETIHPKHAVSSGFQPQPYYQVFALKHGFQPNLSCIDLLFQMGPESLLTLQAHNQY